MKDFFKTNLSLKLLSVAIAMLLWLLVVNVSKPEVSDTKTVQLEVLNQDAFASENKTWQLDGKDTVQISYRVRTDQMKKISSSDFRAYIDLEDYSITGAVPVYVEVLNEKDSLVKDVEARPQVVKIEIEDIQQKKFDLNAKAVGQEMEGYSVANIIVSPESIYAIGPESEIGRISSIGIEVPVNGLTASVDGVAEPVFYDANKNKINVDSSVSLSQTEIAYTVTIHKLKLVNLQARITGVPASGYHYEGTTISPESIQLSGVESVMETLNVLNLPQININGATDSITQKIDVADLLPAGVELTEPGSEVVVTVRIIKTPVSETTPAESETEDVNETEADSITESAAENTQEVEADNAQESRQEMVEESAKVPGSSGNEE